MSDGSTASEIYIGLGGGGAPDGPRQSLVLKRANRHGLIAGATGTGKTVTLQGLAEGFSAVGVPVFVADVKGDLAGMAMAGSPTAKVHEPFSKRAAEIGDSDWAYRDNPVIFWDLFGEQGHPIRTTISEMGPLLLARLMGLNEVQEGVLAIAFRVADEQNLLLLDLGDLQAMLAWCAENADELTTKYGNVSKATVGTIQRQLLTLESQGGDHFFGEPALDVHDMIRCDDNGRGYVNILAADKLMASPKLYATFLLWLLSEMFETLPEIGDPDKPKLVFFFDEAHLLFDDAPPALTEKIEQVVRLIRSKGVGVYFVTQNPIDIPEDVAGQLGNRIQHALRAFTPRDQKAVKATAQTMRPKAGLDIEAAITELAVGEALVSLLDAKGRPTETERVFVVPPGSQIGPITPEQRQALLRESLVAGTYEKVVDRESAYEMFRSHAGQRGEAEAPAAGAAKTPRIPGAASPDTAGAEEKSMLNEVLFGRTGPRGGQYDGLVQTMAKTAARTVASGLGRQILRGVLGGLLGGKR